MNTLERRQFIKNLFFTAGGLALWGSYESRAAEIILNVTSGNNKDTIQEIELFLVKTIRMRIATPYFVWVRIRTKNGLTGYGECYTVENSIKWVEKYMQSLKGRNISDLINQFYLEALKDYDPERANRDNMAWAGAISCLEIALWDILGKMANLPVHELLGGAVRDKIPLYANHAIFKGDGPDDFNRILYAKELGFEMFKWDPFKGAPETEKEIRKQIEVVEKVRDALGPDFKIAIDAHRRWRSPKGALLAAKAMEPLNISFFEEPFHHTEIDMFKILSAHTDIPLASGEVMTHQGAVRDLVSSNTIRYLQPDVGNFGGILATIKACEFANVYNIEISTHNWSGPLSTLAAIQCTAVIPNLYRQEWPHLGFGLEWETEIIKPQLIVENGKVKVPKGPGIGAVPNIDRLKKANMVYRPT